MEKMVALTQIVIGREHALVVIVFAVITRMLIYHFCVVTTGFVIRQIRLWAVLFSKDPLVPM